MTDAWHFLTKELFAIVDDRATNLVKGRKNPPIRVPAGSLVRFTEVLHRRPGGLCVIPVRPPHARKLLGRTENRAASAKAIMGRRPTNAYNPERQPPRQLLAELEITKRQTLRSVWSAPRARRQSDRS
jgi:hypothetical protein